ncbi:MAG: 2Fe-2S iron-sulfur cluster-binding protein [Alphaproteobacteria bacterium]
MPKITFIQKSGHIVVNASLEESVMEAAVRHGVAIEAICEGSLACATCHMVVAPEWFHKLPKMDHEEEDMLNLVPSPVRTSRLSCQIKVTPDIDGVIFSIPESY